MYPQKIKDALQKLSFAGRTRSANAVGTGASFACGSFVRFRIRIDPDTKRIEEIAFESNGCGYMVAAADTLANEYDQRVLTELRGLDHAAIDEKLSDSLDDFPQDRAQCRSAVLEALESAFADFRALQIEEFRGESALICSCFGVSEDRINEVISSGDAVSVEDVTNICNAGGGCGSCRMLIQEILESEQGRSGENGKR